MAKTHLLETEDCADAVTDLRDGGGLVLQVTPRKGEDGFARSWLWRYRFKGRDREIGLGPLDRVSLTSARYLVEKYRADWLDKGLDPKVERGEAPSGARLRADQAVHGGAASGRLPGHEGA